MKYTEKMIELAAELGMQQARAQSLEDELTGAYAQLELRDLELREELAEELEGARNMQDELTAEVRSIREQLSEAHEEAGRQRRRAERAETERDDARDELNNIPAAPGLAAGARRARKTMRRGIVTESGADR